MKIAGIFLVIILVMGGIGYWYYTDTQAKMAILQENNAKLEIAIATSEEALKSVQADFAKASEENNRLNNAYAEIRRQNNRLSSKLADMDLSLLAVEKPDSIERAINRGTVNAGRCFELLSGAILTDEERNAEDAKTFNKECPWLWPGPATSGMSGEQSTKND